ncbi:MAG: N-acetylglucosamine-6-phosphate deacetylase [Lachnospiraceae bacterium]|nr:N-acetylglucosamine-6-phosphate deacetylase [Lachnospiraceae bacterium]
MQIINGLVFCEDGILRKAAVHTSETLITEISTNESLPGSSHSDEEILDAGGCIVAPGFVDIHIHGAAGRDFCDSSRESNDAISAYLSSVGVTSYLGTTMARPREELRQMMRVAADCMDAPRPGSAVMRGINLEGPFSNKEKKGAMMAEMLLSPDCTLVDELNALCGGRLIFADVAPELAGGQAFVQKASQKYVVSLAHTAADYDTAVQAFLNGATHVTHLYNAMPPFSHRAPGVIGAAMDYARDAELICDGIHVHPAAVRAAFSLLGPDRICLISDAMRACGMPDGDYELGGQPVRVKDGLATLSDGTIAGSATPLSECFRRAVKLCHIPLQTALKAATHNPARAARLENEIGSISAGKRADFTLLDQDTLLVRGCVIGGETVFFHTS